MTTVQRHHEQISQREERKIRSDAAFEEAKRKEKAMLEEKKRLEKAKAEAEVCGQLFGNDYFLLFVCLFVLLFVFLFFIFYFYCVVHFTGTYGFHRKFKQLFHGLLACNQFYCRSISINFPLIQYEDY